MAQTIVLVVDDEEHLRTLFSDILVEEGYHVQLAKDGPDGLKKARAVEPNVILLDLMLPGRGGLEVLRELQSAGLGHIPVVLITARQLDPATIEMMRMEPNVKGFLEKPIQPGALPAAIKRALDESKP